MKKNTFFIIGKHAVTEALKNPNRKCLKIYLTDQAKRNLNRDNQNENLLKNIQVFFKSKRELDNLSGNHETSHQGMILECEDKVEISLKDYLKENDKKNINFILLDSVTDPRNIGSIVRSAVAFKIDGIIVKERSFPEKSKLVFKSASGGMEHIKIFKVSNLNMSIKFLKTKNFWISAFDNTGSKDFTNNKWIGRNALLFGSEGEGIKKKTLEHADFDFKISIENEMESLNISNSVSIVCHHIYNSIKKNNN